MIIERRSCEPRKTASRSAEPARRHQFYLPKPRSGSRTPAEMSRVRATFRLSTSVRVCGVARWRWLVGRSVGRRELDCSSTALTELSPSFWVLCAGETTKILLREWNGFFVVVPLQTSSARCRFNPPPAWHTVKSPQHRVLLWMSYAGVTWQHKQPTLGYFLEIFIGRGRQRTYGLSKEATVETTTDRL